MCTRGRESWPGGGHRRRRRRPSSTLCCWPESWSQGKVFVDKERCGGRINCQGRSLLKGEFATGGSALCELRHRASGALIPQEDCRCRELRELEIKLGLQELLRLVVLSIESFFVKFGSFVVVAGGARMHINLRLASPNSLTRDNLYPQLLDRFEFS